jgi:hypothetical protein
LRFSGRPVLLAPVGLHKQSLLVILAGFPEFRFREFGFADAV